MNYRHALLSISLAWLLNLGGWIAITDGRGGHSEYFLEHRPAFVLEMTTLLTTAGTALVLFWALPWLDRRPGYGRSIRELILLTGACAGTLRAGLYVGWFVRATYGDSVLARVGAFVINFCVIGCVTFGLLYHRRRIIKTLDNLLFRITPVILINIGSVAWISTNLALRTDYSDQAVADGVSSGERGARLIWVIFDEMDAELAFERRPAGLSLPELDGFRANSVYVTDARPPGDSTLWCIPALTTGRAVRFAKPGDNRTLNLSFADGSAERSWRETPNIFSAAYNIGVKTALVGWYHPYCRIFGDLTASCFWSPAEHLRRSVISDKLGIAQYFLPHLLFTFGPSALLIPDALTRYESQVVQELHAESNGELWRKSIEVVADRRYSFVFLHIPLPHPPGVRRDRGKFLATSSSSYVENFELADELLGEWRRALENAGMWDDAAVILTSDHSLRAFWQPMSLLTDIDRKYVSTSSLGSVPLLIKLPRQRQAIAVDVTIRNSVTYEMALGILGSEFKDEGDLAHWLRVRAKGRAR